MGTVARFLHTNHFVRSDAVRSASSSDSSFPIGYLLDQMRSKTWRSKLGWNVGFWNKLDFKEAGVARAATVASGNYATGALMATAVQTAMNAAAVSNTYTVTYDASTHKFTIARATGSAALDLPWSTGTNATTSCGKDLGFDVSADATGATTYTGANVSYHTREWLKADLGSAMALTAGVALNHNVSAGAIRLQANATDAWTAPTLDQALSTVMDETIASPAGRLAFFGQQTLRWVRILIDDVSNSLGYSEVGIVYAGSYFQPTYQYSNEFQEDGNDLSLGDKAARGAHYQNLRPEARHWSFKWVELPTTDRDLLAAAVRLSPKFKDFFFAFDAVNSPAKTVYCYRDSDLAIPVVSGDYYDVSFTAGEAMP